MLHAQIKDQIKKAYSNIRLQLPHFVPRKTQNFLVAEIAKTLAGEYQKERRIIVAEAGTGIGKSLAYLLGSIPYAMFENKKIVIATATVSLQEQLFHKDLPLFLNIYEGKCQISLAKGRQRYCCKYKLEMIALSNKEDLNQQSLFDFKPKVKDIELYKKLYAALISNKWDGDRDTWPKSIPDKLWQHIVSNKHTCQPGFRSHRHCPFTQARESISKSQVIVANHSLLMADLELGGGVILPELEKTVYMIDEAHHFPIIARDFSAVSASVLGSIYWLEKLDLMANKLTIIETNSENERFLANLHQAIQSTIANLQNLHQHFIRFPFDENKTFRFQHGAVPNELNLPIKTLATTTLLIFKSLKSRHDALSEKLKIGEISAKIAEPLLEESAYYLNRCERLTKLWEQMAKSDSNHKAPLAKWITLHPERENDLLIHTSLIEVGDELEKKFWSKAAGVGLFSATIRALNNFSFFCRQTGLKNKDGTQFISLASPFNFTKNATLLIPKTPFEPSHENFTSSLPKLILRYLKDQKSSLVLFSSYWQMNEVAKQTQLAIEKMGGKLLLQGEGSRQLLIKEHIKRCENQQISVLFGTASFSEGLDLPGELLTNLIITKIPFAVPTSPIEEAYAEYIEQQGGNPFLQITIPDTSKKLVQSVGRLLRKEQDQGRIVLLDRRIVTKRYGKFLLNTLPPFNILIE